MVVVVVGGGLVSRILPEWIRRPDFNHLVPRMKLCVSGRYCFCIFDSDYKGGEAVSARTCATVCVCAHLYVMRLHSECQFVLSLY